MDSGCWEWTGGKTTAGYGTFWNGERHEAAHRFGYRALVSEIPDGQELHHICRNPLCCNPRHLVAHDIRTHRNIHGNQYTHRTHCKNGHEYTPENTYYYADRRVCKKCNRAAERRWKAKRRAARDAA